MAETICKKPFFGDVLPIVPAAGKNQRSLLRLFLGLTLCCALLSPVMAEESPDTAPTLLAPETSPRPQIRRPGVPATRFRHRPEAALWTRAMLSALKGHAKPLVEVVPRDIAEWCPAYPGNPPEARAAFWAGFASALAKHESTYRPDAVGGGGRWYGLLQILPATARWRGCRAGTGPALTRGAANLSCALRIMAITVPRDKAIALRDSRWRGVAADWGPMRTPSKRNDMANWLKQQPYCQALHSVRPRLRPSDWPPPG